MNLRRHFTFAVGAAGAGLALRLFAQTPTPSAKRLGILTQGMRANAQPFFEGFADEMVRAGWQEGRNIVYDWSSADGRQALLRQRAEELVARKPDAIYAGSQAGTLAAKQAGVPLRIVVIENRDAAVLYERRLVLVRPDGHVAWRGDRVEIDPEELLATVTGWKIGSHSSVQDPAHATAGGR